jgi:hypothetical protein
VTFEQLFYSTKNTPHLAIYAEKPLTLTSKARLGDVRLKNGGVIDSKRFVIRVETACKIRTTRKEEGNEKTFLQGVIDKLEAWG